MLISGFLFGIAYLSLQLFQKRYRDFMASTERLLEISQAEYLLYRDFSSATSIEADGNTVLFRNDSTRTDYVFTEAYLLRRQLSLVDTFHWDCQERRTFWLGKPTSDKRGPMDELSFRCQVQGEVFDFHFQKQYDAQQRMRTERQPGNRD